MITHVLEEIDPRVLGARLQEARKAAGATQQAIADELRVARTTIVAIEKGERRPTPHELLRFARLYGRSVGELLSRTQVLEQFVPQFRATLKQELAEDTSIEAIVLELQRFAGDYLELEGLMNLPLTKVYPPPYAVSGVPAEQAAEEIATSERNRLGLGDGPLAALRRTLESDVGLRISYLPMPAKIGGVFAYQETIGGCISINANHPVERQNWSLAHEYGHFLTSRFSPEVMILRSQKRSAWREQLADHFAKHFLMPGAALNRRFSDIHRSNPSGVTLADVCSLADLYHVSVQAMVLRLEELKRLPAGTWDGLAAKGFKPKEAQRLLGLRDAEPEEMLPTRYEYLAVQAYRDGKLSEGQLARLLHVDRVTARQRVDELRHRVFSEEDGRFEGLSVDLAQLLDGSRR